MGEKLAELYQSRGNVGSELCKGKFYAHQTSVFLAYSAFCTYKGSSIEKYCLLQWLTYGKGSLSLWDCNLNIFIFSSLDLVRS